MLRVDEIKRATLLSVLRRTGSGPRNQSSMKAVWGGGRGRVSGEAIACLPRGGGAQWGPVRREEGRRETNGTAYMLFILFLTRATGKSGF